jgi:hypothetical protein
MSRGPGHVERTITGVFAAEPNRKFTALELARHVYGENTLIEKKHRVAVTRAANKLQPGRLMTEREIVADVLEMDPDAPGEITAEKLKHLLHTWRVFPEGGPKMPKVENLVDLARIMTGARIAAAFTAAARGSYLRAAAVQKAIGVLAHELPAVQDDLRHSLAASRGQGAGTESTAFLLRELHLIEVLAKAVGGIARNPRVSINLAALAPPTEHWPDYVMELANAFRDAIKTANRGHIGKTRSSATARFLPKAIKLISDETVTQDQVARHLERRSALLA